MEKAVFLKLEIASCPFPPQHPSISLPIPQVNADPFFLI